MNCRKARNYLSAYIDGELPGVEHGQVREHLSVCWDCREEYEGTLEMKRMLGGLRSREPRAELSQIIAAGVERERARAEHSLPNLLRKSLLRLQREVPVSPAVAFAGGAAVLVMIAAANVTQWGSPARGNIEWQSADDSRLALFDSPPPIADPAPLPALGRAPFLPVSSGPALPPNAYGSPYIPQYGAPHFHGPVAAGMPAVILLVPPRRPAQARTFRRW